jgi:hypothetical protein
MMAASPAASAAAASCRTFSLTAAPHCPQGAVTGVRSVLVAKGLRPDQSADIAAQLACPTKTRTREIGDLHIQAPEMSTKVTLKTRFNVTAKDDDGDWTNALERLLEDNRRVLTLEPTPGLTYQIVEPVESRGEYSTRKELGCLASNARVTITAGGQTFTDADARDGVLSISTTRPAFYRLQTTVHAYPDPLDVSLCISRTQMDCRSTQTAKASGDDGASIPVDGTLILRRQETAVRVAADPVEVQQPSQTRTVSPGGPTLYSWRIDPKIAKRVKLSFTVDDDGNQIKPAEIKLDLPVWAGALRLLPAKIQDIILLNYKKAYWFAGAMLLLMAAAAVALKWLKERSWFKARPTDPPGPAAGDPK